MLKGKHIKLREYRTSDLPVLTEMMNDENARANTTRGIVTPMTAAMVAAHFAAGEDPACFHYMVEDEAGQLVGFIEIDNAFKDRRCELTFQIKPSGQGKGYGSEALDLILRMAFLEMNMNRCTTTILDFNQAAARILEKAGFTREVTLRDDVFRQGRYHDAHVLGLLREEYLERMNRSKQPVTGSDASGNSS